MSTLTRHRVCEGCTPHPSFEIAAGDRSFARQEFDKALAFAVKRAEDRGRQTVRLHRSSIFKRGVWLVQDVR
jgi:LDH2 family malate/lactate/ureidoglycolate dehydrogenase